MNKQIIVSKFGSSLIANRETGLYQEQIDNYALQLVEQHEHTSHIFVVSGARAMGLFRADRLFSETERDQLTDKQLAGLGATAVFYAFEQAFEKIGVTAASYPITHHLLEPGGDSELAAERTSFIDVLRGNAEAGIVSIINEADAMNDKELMKLLFGFKYEIDNDLLAAHIASAVGASSLTLWKKEGGLRDAAGLYIPEINNNNFEEYHQLLSGREKSRDGRGGPETTLDALAMAARSGVQARAAGVTTDMRGINETKVVVG